MDQSIFSLFTTKDWPFQSQTNTHDHSQQLPPPTQLDHLSNVKPLRSRRDTIDGMLFFDRLLQLGSVSNFRDLYPPPRPSRLRQLLDSIDACAFDFLKKNCLVYYLLKEYGDHRETRFAIDRLIPTHFTRGLDGLWALDHSDWKTAIRSMSDPTVTPDFLPEIIHTLATQPPVKLRSHYVMRFYQLTQPSLDLQSIEFVLRAMCTNCQLRSAWALQRSYSRPERDQLLRIVFETCFGLNDLHQPLPDSLQILIAFPFDKLEDSVLSSFALHAPKVLPESHSMVVIHFYLSKLTSEAHYIEAIRFERALSELTQIGSNPQIDRIIRGIALILPEVQRNMLEVEFDQQHPILNEAQTSPGNAQNVSDEMDLSTTYDVCSLAWDPPPSPPALPPPSSLVEARSQQELLNPPKTSIDRSSLPLSASPIFRRAMPRMSLDKSNVPQKVLLKALAFTRQPSAPNSPDVNQSPRPQINQTDEPQESSTLTSPAATSRSTPHFQHFVGPSSRLPPSATKPPPQPNFSTSFSRSTVTTTGSPFHRLSFPDLADRNKTSPKSGEDRWPTRIVFTPRRPPSQSQKKPEERLIMPRQPINRKSSKTIQQNRGNTREQVRSSKPVRSSSSSDEDDDVNSEEEQEEQMRANQNPPVAKQFTAVVVPSKDLNKQREPKSPPKKIAQVNNTFQENTRSTPRRVNKVLPGGFQVDDEEMEGPLFEEKQTRTQNENQSLETFKTPYRSSNARKKVKVNNHNNPVQSNGNNSNVVQVVPITPRRSTRLHSTTPAKTKKLVLPGGMIDHDLTEDEERENYPKTNQEDEDKLSSSQNSNSNSNKKKTSLHNNKLINPKSKKKIGRN